MNGPVYAMFAWDASDVVYDGFNTDYCQKKYGYMDEFNLNNPAEFLTNPDVKKYYKQRIKYIYSRWGYSQNIAMFELMSEINQVDDSFIIDYNFPDPIPDSVALNPNSWWLYANAISAYNPYLNEYQHRVNTYLWQKEMAEYIKNELQHKNQILSCSYAGPPDFNGDATFSIPELDIVSMNRSADGKLDYVRDRQIEIAGVHNLYDKPIICSEVAINPGYQCSDKSIYNQTLWQVAFSGIAGFNFWDGQYNDFAPQWAEMKKFKDWIMNDPVKKEILLGAWETGHDNGTIRGSSSYFYFRKDLNYIVEANAIGNPPTKRAFGSLVNLTDNYYTNLSIDSSWCDGFDNSNPWYTERKPYDFLLVNIQDKIFLKNNLSSQVDPLMNPWNLANNYGSTTAWYDFETLNTISNFETTISFGNVTVPLNHPTLFVTQDSVSIYGNRGIIPFEIEFFPIVSSGMVTNSNSNTNHQNANLVAFKQDEVLIIHEYRQATTAMHLKEDEQFSNRNMPFQVFITNLIGQKTYEGSIDLNDSNRINTTNFPHGLLLITLVNNKEKHILRWLNL